MSMGAKMGLPRVALLTLVCPFIALSSASADSSLLTNTYTYSTTSKIETSQATVNIVAGALQVPLRVDGWDNHSGANSTNFLVGDGRNGSFNSSTYLNFDNGTYAGNHVIHINTDEYSDLQFTDFTLDAGWTILPVGSKSLVIRSLSTITIATGAEINCDGEPGGAMVAASSAALGGVAHCGGFAGGQGASSTLAATAGFAPSAYLALAGQPGASASVGGGGGAGLANTSNTPDGGRNAAGALTSAAGSLWPDNQFLYNIGGGGGAGGTVGTSSSGAGGGAGGGLIYLYAVGDITIAGLVHANGGDGGSGTGSQDGGGGGGGAGGSILAFSAGNLIINSAIQAVGGAAGLSGAGGTTSAGGKGSDGRSWMTDNNGAPSGSGSISPPCLLDLTGSIDSQVGSFNVVSKLIDLDVSRASFSSAVVNGAAGGGNIALDLAVSDLPFTADSAVWRSATSLADSNGHRYLRYRLRLVSPNTTSPPSATSVVIQYSAQDQQKFSFASCQLVKGSGGSGRGPGILLFLFMMPLLMWASMRSKNRLPADT